MPTLQKTIEQAFSSEPPLGVRLKQLLPSGLTQIAVIVAQLRRNVNVRKVNVRKVNVKV
jgi:hypothetical protein